MWVYEVHRITDITGIADTRKGAGIGRDRAVCEVSGMNRSAGHPVVGAMAAGAIAPAR